MPDPGRIAARLQELWDIRRGPGGGADRPAYSDAEAAAMRLVAGWAADAGLEPAIDPHGNLWALPPAWDGPLVTAGSHVDTVPDGGRYDGALGTVLGLEFVLDLAGRSTQGGARSGLLVCAAEEAPRFGAGTIGSRLLVGTLEAVALEALTDADGITAARAQGEYLRALRDLPVLREPPGSRLRAHGEIHVAQRWTVRTVAVVKRVASPRRFALRVTGRAGHSGEVSMEERRDALAAAAEMILAVEAAARAEPAETVATVGTLRVSPGAVSVIPGDARLAIDVRGVSAESLARVEATVRGAVEDIAQRRGVDAELELVRGGEPVMLDRGLASAALAAARRLGVPADGTWSGAGHDAQHLAALAPTLLLFVPLHGGESHTPDEGADMDEIVQAASIMISVLRDVRA